jgi:hypothetical protein
MDRWTVGSIFRASFYGYAKRHGLSLEQHRAARALIACRTEEMGGYDEECPEGDYAERRYYSCRHRSCPRCNGALNQAWLERIKDYLLPCAHYHVIFTLPHELNALWGYNRVWFSEQLFRQAAESLRQMLRDPRHLGAEPGMILAEHTWGRTLVFHPHVHCLVSAGGLSEGRWVEARRGYLVPGRALSTLFRGKWLAALNAALDEGELRLPEGWDKGQVRALLRRIAKQRWNVRIDGQYAQGAGVAVYLSRYLRGGPIGDQRITSFSDGKVAFRYQDHRDGKHKILSLATEEFLRRVLAHVPPNGRHRIRYYGLYRPQATAAHALARTALGEIPPTAAPPPHNARSCPHCGTPLRRRHWRWSKISLYRDPTACSVQPAVQPDTRPNSGNRFQHTGPPDSIFLAQRVPVN